MISVGDPIKAGFAQNLARPGKNITGNTILGTEMAAKRVQLLKQLIPGVSRVAFLWNPYNGSHLAYLEEWRAAAPILGIEALFVEAGRPDQLEPLQQRYYAALEKLLMGHSEAFRGTELDPAENVRRMEKLIARVEKLAAEQTPAPASSSQALAAMLREALASNQIGGRSSEESRWRAAAEEVKQAQASWKRIGPVSPEAGRELNDRFRRACDRVFEQHRRKASLATRS